MSSAPHAGTTVPKPATDGSESGLVTGHAQYVKGIVKETIGSVTGSAAWSESGVHDKEAGIQQMKDASASRDPATQGKGAIEETAGKLVGCEGMVKEGEASK